MTAQDRTKPALMDWLLLVYVGLVLVSPGLILWGIITPAEARAITLWFPWGPVFLALGLIVLRSAVPVTRMEFALSGPCWTTILICAVVLAMLVYSFPLPSALSINSKGIKPGAIFNALPALIILARLLFVILHLFRGAPIGPKHGRRAP